MEIVDNNNNNNNNNNQSFKTFFLFRLRQYMKLFKLFMTRFVFSVLLCIGYQYFNYLISKLGRRQDMMAKDQEYEDMVYDHYICAMGKYLWKMRGFNDWSPELCYHLHKQLYKYAQQYKQKYITVADTYMYVK